MKHKPLREIVDSLNINGFENDGTDKLNGHNYGEVYERILKPWRNEPINALEIGTQNGGSAVLWSHVLPKAQILMIDIHNGISDRNRGLIDLGRVTLHTGDGYSDHAVAFARQHFSDGVDFAVDDGPHTLQSMCSFLQLYAPIMKKGGVMVIEDIQEAAWLETLKTHVPWNCKFEEWNKSAETGRWDDIMLIVTI